MRISTLKAIALMLYNWSGESNLVGHAGAGRHARKIIWESMQVCRGEQQDIDIYLGVYFISS